MKNLFQNTSKISVTLIAIFFIVTLLCIFFHDQFLPFLPKASHDPQGVQHQSHWEMLRLSDTSNSVGVSCDLIYPIFFSGSTRVDFGQELFRNIWKQDQGNISIEKCEGYISPPIFQDGGWGYSSGMLAITFSGGVQSIFEIDRAFNVSGSLIANDYDFHIDVSSLTHDLLPYFGKNITHTLSLKIEQMTRQGRIIAPNEHERILFFHKTPTVSWPSDWKIIRFVGSKNNWHIDISFNPIKRYSTQNVSVHPEIQDKILSLTFDDGPSNKYTPIILDILKAHDIRATFCILGSQAIKYPELVRRIYEEGHEICNHSVSHSNFTLVPLTQVQSELIQNEKIINDILGMSMIIPFVRPPYGAISLDMERELNTPFALWSVDTLDWKDQRPKSIMKRASVAQSGDIVLFHDIHPGAIKMLDAYISQYSSEGYSFVTLSQMVNSGTISGISGQSLFALNKIRYLYSEKKSFFIGQ